jgi:hypothetical protein
MAERTPAKPAKGEAKLFYTSPSALSNYFSCPAKYAYSRAWKPAKVDADLQDGIMAHAVMELRTRQDWPASGLMPKDITSRAAQYVNKLSGLMRDEGYQLLRGGAEKKMSAELPGQIVLRHIVDQIAVTREGEPVILDYKTGDWPWKEKRPGESGKSLGSYASVTYLLPRKVKGLGVRGLKQWPQRIDYLKVSSNGKPQVFTYRPVQADLDNLIEAAGVVRAATAFPRNRGINCDYCPFRSKCFGYEQPGEYVLKTDEHFREEPE